MKTAETARLTTAMRALIICPDTTLVADLREVLEQSVPEQVVRVIGEYPEPEKLLRIIRILAPTVVFVSAANPARLANVVTGVRSCRPATQFVAINDVCTPDVLLTAMRLGIQEFVNPPLDRETVSQCVDRAMQAFKDASLTAPEDSLVYTFIPAKQGVGTTTLAVNAALWLGSNDITTFLGDFDMNCGLVRFMLKLQNQNSVAEAASVISTIDDTLWQQLVTSMQKLDIMHAGTIDPHVRVEPAQIMTLLDLVRRMYRVAVMDLSGNLEKFSIEMMHESTAILLVTTAEMPALHLTREKLRFLHSINLGDRVQVLLNRVSKASLLNVAQVEEIIGRTVHMSFPNDYATVHNALGRGEKVSDSSLLGQQCRKLGEWMNRTPCRVEQSPRRKTVAQYLVGLRSGETLKRQ
jgi:pilus assembly protein CpaE